jgi:hypothetical protein
MISTDMSEMYCSRAELRQDPGRIEAFACGIGEHLGAAVHIPDIQCIDSQGALKCGVEAYAQYVVHLEVSFPQ